MRAGGCPRRKPNLEPITAAGSTDASKVMRPQRRLPSIGITEHSPSSARHQPGNGLSFRSAAKWLALAATIFAVLVTILGMAFRSWKSVSPIASPTQ